MSDVAPLSRTATFAVPGGLDAASVARHSILPRYSWPSPRVRDAAALMLGEVVANAVLHGGAGAGREVRIDVDVNRRAMTFSVHDPGPGFIPAPPDRPLPEGGLGLVIVDRLARRWGVVAHPRGSRVWFEVAMA
jgi:anti-sigma regulatory factor (Ser/Thr protein kinase)